MTIRPKASRRATLGRRIYNELSANWQLYLLILPPLIYLVIFQYWPMLGTQIAFKDFKATKGIWGSPWASSRGAADPFKHFNRFLRSSYSLQIIGNTVTLSLYQLLAKFPCCLLLALMMNELRSARLKKAVQLVTYAPHFISTIIVVGIMQQLFAAPSALMKTGGVVNALLGKLGMTPVPFMESAATFKHMYVWSGIWASAGWGSIIYLAALSNVDPQHYEAATLDGATKLQKIWYITLPVLIPTAVTLFILDVGHVMNVGFEKAYAMQNDLNRTSSQILATYVYTQGIKEGNYSFSTAISLFNSVINLVLICTVNAVSRKVSEVSLW